MGRYSGCFVLEVRLLKATVDDAESLVSIQKKVFERLYGIYGDENSPYLRGTGEFYRWLGNPDAHVFKILADGVLCGGIPVLKKTDYEYYLLRIYILPQLQGKGIATEAIRLCEALFDDAKRWTPDFPIDQAANKRCYEKAGYIDAGTREAINDKFTLAVYEKVI